MTPFEPHRFLSTVAHYRAARPVYPPALWRLVAELVRLDAERDAVIDIGCGPGPVAIGFAYFAANVLAIDPEPAMLAAAREAAQGLVPNLRFLQASSYDLSPGMGRFRLATMGRSFHWMDRADTLRRLDAMLHAAGAVALFDDEHIDVPDNAWRKPWREILKLYAAGDQVRQRIDSPDWPRHETLLLASPFNALQRVSIIARAPVSTQTLIARASSMSSTAPARLGDRTAAMREELAAALAGFAEDGMVTEVVEFSALIACRTGEHPPARERAMTDR